MSRTDPLVKVPIVRSSPRGTAVVSYASYASVEDKVRRGYHGLAAEDVTAFEPMAKKILAESPHAEAALRRCHARVADALRYCWEDEEILVSPLRAFARGCGSCAHHAMLGGCLVAALDRVAQRQKIPVRFASAIVAMGGPEDDPEHASLLVAHAPADVGRAVPRAELRGGAIGREPPIYLRPFAGAPDGWIFSETSEPAAFGEEPYRAAVRVGGSRARLTIVAA